MVSLLPIDIALVKRMLLEPYWCKVKMECTKMGFRFAGNAAQFAILLRKSKYIQWLAFILPDWHSRCF